MKSKLHASFDTFRTGRKYRVQNYGDKYEFEVLDIIPGGDFKLKDLYTLEVFYLNDIIRYGKGEDFDIDELPDNF